MSAFGASENPLSVVEYGLPVLEVLLTSTVTALPYGGLPLLDWAGLDRLFHKPCRAQHGQQSRADEADAPRLVQLTASPVSIPEVPRHFLLLRGPPIPDVAEMVHAPLVLVLLGVFRPFCIMRLALQRSQRQPKQPHKLTF